MKKETLFKKTSELYEQILPIQNKIRKKSEEYIKRVLQEHPDGINFDDYPVANAISVNYDGGSHPEYASNCFSIVYGVYSNEKGNVVLNIEDCDEYPIENLNWDEAYTVAEYLSEYID